MKTEYQYIHFIKLADKPKTSVWSCRNTKSDFELGTIQWYLAWRQYCFFPTNAVFNAGCLADIQDFIGQLKARKDGKIFDITRQTIIDDNLCALTNIAKE